MLSYRFTFFAVDDDEFLLIFFGDVSRPPAIGTEDGRRDNELVPTAGHSVDDDEPFIRHSGGVR